MTQISIVLGSYNRFPFLQLAIESIRSQADQVPLEIIVIDGGSTDGALQWLLDQRDIITIIQHNRGTWQGKKITRRSWGYFMNLGFKAASGKYICMISDDCVLLPKALANGYEEFERRLAGGEEIGAMAFYWRELIKDDFYHVGVPMNSHMYVNHGLYLTKALQEVNFIEEDYYDFYCADVDLCFKLWHAGKKVIAGDNSFVDHYPFANVTVRNGNEAKAKNDRKKLIARWQFFIPNINDRDLGYALRKKHFSPEPEKALGTFSQLHEKNLEENPKLLQVPWTRTLYLILSWKYILLKRSITRRLKR